MAPRGAGRPYKNGNRWWGNFENFADVGGKREPLVVDGQKLATDDPEIALVLYGRRLEHYRELRRTGVATRTGPDVLPAVYAAKSFLPHLERQLRAKRRLRADDPLPSKEKARLEKARHSILTCLEQPALAGVSGLGAIKKQHVTQLIVDLRSRVRKRNGELISPDTVRRHLMELSALFKRACFEDLMKTNPLNEHPDIPPVRRATALMDDQFLPRSQVTALLQNVLPSTKSPWAVEQAYTLYYTGCRIEEMNGLLVRDIDFDSQEIRIAEYEHRGLKTNAAVRAVPLWPKLAAVLKASLARRPRPPHALLFSRPDISPEAPLEQQMIGRMLKSLRSAARRAGLPNTKIGHHIARHSYISARIQMVEKDVLGRDVPVALPTIVREVGHTTPELIRTTYGHVTKERVRQSILDYGDELPDLDERVTRAERLMSAAIKEGIAKARRRPGVAAGVA